MPHQRPSLLQVSAPARTDDHPSLPPGHCLVALCAMLRRYGQPPPCCYYSGGRSSCSRIPSRPGILVSWVHPSLRPSNTARPCFGSPLPLLISPRAKQRKHAEERKHSPGRTSVARFPNGTVINLAKVPAGDEYTAHMERMVREPAPQDRPGRLESLWGLLMQALRMPPTRDAAILMRMAAALKAESEAALGGRAIDSAAVTAPWVASWDGQVPSNSIIHDVLVLVGIEPVSWEGSHPMYLGETNSLLAANKLRLCLDRWCGVDSVPSGQGAVAFLIRYVKLVVGVCYAINGCSTVS